MVLSEALSSFLWLILAVLTLGAILIVRRGGSVSAQDSSSAREENELRETRLAGRVANLEVRLYDIAREFEARLETRSLQLDQLVAEADREIIRLTDLLKAASGRAGAPGPDMVHGQITSALSTSALTHSAAGASPDNPPAEASESGFALSAATEQVVLHLHDAGYSLPEIAHMVGRPVDQIRSLLRAA